MPGVFIASVTNGEGAKLFVWRPADTKIGEIEEEGAKLFVWRPADTWRVQRMHGLFVAATVRGSDPHELREMIRKVGGDALSTVRDGRGSRTSSKRARDTDQSACCTTRMSAVLSAVRHGPSCMLCAMDTREA